MLARQVVRWHEGGGGQLRNWSAGPWRNGLDRYPTKFSKDKCRVPHRGKEEPLQWYRLENDAQGSSSAEKYLWTQADSKMDMSQQYALVAKKAKVFRGCVNSGTARRLRDVIIPFPKLLRWNCSTESSFGTSVQEKLTNWSKFRRDHQYDWGLEPCEERRRWLELFGLQKKWLCRRRTAACQLLQGSCREDGARLCGAWCEDKRQLKKRGSSWL